VEVKYLLMIAGMLVVTYLPRVLPLAILTKMEIPEIIIRWLRFIPAAILAALLTPGILLVDGKLVLNHHNVFLLAALPTFAVAIYKKNIFLTVITGMLTVAALRWLL
jgi:branched-subunit amino acid transport protein